MNNLLKSAIKNKVVFYLASRYVTYAIQFITSLVIAAELGPYYMGIWGFILLLLQYFQQFHFGIANSFNVLYVHHRDNNQACNNYIGNSMALVSYLALLVICFYIYYAVFGISGFEKYHVDGYIIWVCLIAILQYFVQFFINLFRVKNQLNRVTFCQSIIVFLNFFCIFFFSGGVLIKWLVAGYVVGNVLCVLLAFTSGSIPNIKRIDFSCDYQSEILKKGLFLFLYNSCFYFIIISIRTIISAYYTVEEFGMFTFSYTLAHAILLLLEAFSFVIFPKVIAKLSSSDRKDVESTLNMLRTIFITSAHLLIYIALLFFPFILWFFPKYEGALTALNLIALAILMNSNSSGYLELLISRNKERLSALISSMALLINCCLAMVFVHAFHFSYDYIILATMITYMFFSFMVMVYARHQIGAGLSLGEWFPLRLAVPYIIAFFISITQNTCLLFLPITAFLIMNYRQLFSIKCTAVLLLKRPDKINL